MSRIGMGTELLRKILETYRVKYHDTYAKGFRYFIRGKLSFLFLNPYGILCGVKTEEDIHWVYLTNEVIKCTCLDFFYNIVMRHQERSYCSHIIACILGLLSPEKYRRRPEQNSDNIELATEKIKVIIGNIIKDIEKLV